MGMKKSVVATTAKFSLQRYTAASVRRVGADHGGRHSRRPAASLQQFASTPGAILQRSRAVESDVKRGSDSTDANGLASDSSS